MARSGTHTLTSDPRAVILNMMDRAEAEGRRLLAERGHQATPEAVEHAGYVIFAEVYRQTCERLTPESAQKLQEAMQQLEAEARDSAQN